MVELAGKMIAGIGFSWIIVNPTYIRSLSVLMYFTFELTTAHYIDISVSKFSMRSYV